MANIDVAINLIARDMTGNSLWGVGQVLDMIAQQMLGAGANAQDLAEKTLQLGAAAVTADLLWKGFSSTLETAVGDAADLQGELVDVDIATQSSANSLPVLTQAINDLAIKTIYGSSEAADAFARMSEQGFTVSQVLYGLSAPADEYTQHAYDATEATQGLGYQALVLGQALGTDAVSGAQLLGAAVHTFSQDGLTAAQTANLLAGAFFNGVPDAMALQEAIQQGGAAAATTGVQLQDYLTILDLLTQSGMSASSAGSSLNYMLRSLSAPTAAQTKEFASLGLMTENTLNPALAHLEQAVIKAGGASQDQIAAWHGSVTGLQDLFFAAQDIGLIPLDATFTDWAASTGLLNNKFYDSQGQFIGLKGSIDLIDQALAQKSPQEKIDSLDQMFNIKSGRAGAILTNLQEFDGQYESIFARMGNTDVTAAAEKQLNTLKGAADAFKDSLGSALAMAVMPLLPPLTSLITGFNNLLESFMNAPQALQTAVGIFLVAGTVLSGLAVVTAIVAGAIALLAAVGVTLGAVLVPVGIVLGVVAGGAALAGGAFLLFHAAGQQILSVLAPILTFLGNLKDALGSGIQAAIKAVSDVLSGMGQQLQSTFQQAGDSFGRVGQVFQQYGPQIKVVAEIIGGLLVVAIGLLLGLLSGLLGAVVAVFEGIVTFIGGVGQIIAGVIQVVVGLVGGLIQTLGDIIGNHWDRVGADLQNAFQTMWNGTLDIIGGAINAIFGLFGGLVSGVEAFVTGLVSSVIGFFEHLADELVGHSIIPDMVNAIIGVIGRLPGEVVAIIGSLISQFLGRLDQLRADANTAFLNLVNGAGQTVSQLPGRVMSTLSGLPGQLLSLGGQIMSSFASGIQAGLGNVLGTISSAGSRIIGGLKNIVNNIPGVGGIAGALGFAAGGTVPATGLYMVGEQGPELMALPQGAQIYNNPDSMRLLDAMNNAAGIPMMGSGGYGQGGVIHLQVNLGNDTLIDTFMDNVGGQLRVAGINRIGR